MQEQIIGGSINVEKCRKVSKSVEKRRKMSKSVENRRTKTLSFSHSCKYTFRRAQNKDPENQRLDNWKDVI